MDLATRKPPAAGPMIEAVCQAREFQAIARGKRARGTSMGPSAVLAGAKKALAAPNRNPTSSSRGTEAQPCQVATARVRTVAISPAKQNSSTFLRSWRSAVSPAGRVSRKTGTKAASPIIPTRKALSCTDRVCRAMAYICQPMATLWIWAAKPPVQRETQKQR